MTKEQIRRLVVELRDIVTVLATADPKDKAEVYAELGVRVAYDHHRRVIGVTAGPSTTARVEGVRPPTPPPALTGELDLQAAATPIRPWCFVSMRCKRWLGRPATQLTSICRPTGDENSAD